MSVGVLQRVPGKRRQRTLGGGGASSGLHLPGTAGNYISTPDSVLNSITGDIDIRVYAKLDAWGSGASQNLISKFNGPASQKSYRLDSIPGGALQLAVTSDGVTDIAFTSTVAVSFPNGTNGWVRVTLDVDNGASGKTATFYTSTDGITWTPLGSTVTITGVISIFDGTASLQLGAINTGSTLNLPGTIYYAEVRNGIDGPVVAKFDSSQVQVSGSQLPASVNGWTWNGSALYKRDDYVRLPGTAGNYLSFPDTPANSVTGDIDIRMKLALDSWTPAADGYLLSKYDAAVNRAWYFYIASATGRLNFNWSANGSANVGTCTSGVGTGLVAGAVKWVRVTLAVATGQVMFYLSDDGITWTPLGSPPAAAGPTSIFDSTVRLGISDINNSGNGAVVGNVYYAEVRNGINGPVVASFNAADNQDQTPWTINGAGWNWEGASFQGKPGVALSLPGTVGNYVSTPGTNTILGDIDIRAKVAPSAWVSGLTYNILGRWENTATRGYQFRIEPTGLLSFGWTPDGTFGSSVLKSSTIVASGQWVRATLVAATGQVAFFTSSDGAAWTPLGTLPAAAGATSIFASPDLLHIGEIQSVQSLNAKVYYAEVRNGIDGPIVAKFDATNIAKTGTRTPASTVQPGGTPNLLTPNQASIETDASGWTASTGSPTLARSTAQFLDGAASLSLTAVAAGPATIAATSFPTSPIVPGKLYTARCSSRAAATPRQVGCQINWYTGPSSGYISTSTGTLVINTTSGWTEVLVTILAPPTANYAQVGLYVPSSPVAGEVHYFDRVSLVEAAEVWTLNGSAWDLVAV